MEEFQQECLVSNPNIGPPLLQEVKPITSIKTCGSRQFYCYKPHFLKFKHLEHLSVSPPGAPVAGNFSCHTLLLEMSKYTLMLIA